MIDRHAWHRESLDLATIPAVLVRNGQVLCVDRTPVTVPPAVHAGATVRVYLGRLEGADVAAAMVGDDLDSSPGAQLLPPGAQFVGLRDVIVTLAAGGSEGDALREMATTAVAISAWHASHPRCALCGDPTEPRKGGWVRWCARDEREHYPRTDPAIIVAITDDADRLLLAHAALWTARRFSLLAGYMEPGESLEQTVHREVWEEARMEVSDIRYIGSQPWPFPASVMVGFTARATSTEFTLDQEEITEARWVARDELLGLIDSGEIIPAPRGSIARRMIEDWHGGPIPDGADHRRGFG